MIEEIFVIQFVTTIFFILSWLIYKKGNLDEIIFQGICVVFAIITIISMILLVSVAYIQTVP